MFKLVALITFIALVASATEIDDKNAELKSAYNVIDGHGNFKYGHDIANGVEVKAEGDGNVVHGEYYLIDENGKKVKVTYTADSTGFHPVSSLLPENSGTGEL